MNKVDKVWQDFFTDRTEELVKKYPGWHRAMVVETNDPLRMHRIRFKMPEMHNYDLKAEECPWAVPDPSMGGKRAGFWPCVCIGDYIWINFEKGHPYGPIYCGAADPTRRKFYVLESIYGQTQIALNEKGEPAEAPDDYDKNYMPKDERPMSCGFKDRYGNLIYMGSVGFFPKEHKEKPAPVGTDPVTQGEFKASTQPPKENEPDLKLIALISKYGNCFILSDIGYDWKEEFDGDFEEDEDFEIKRWKYIQKQLSEGTEKGIDQRRMEWRSRYGHKLEMRDVGWSEARPGEYEGTKLAKVKGKNEPNQTWIKFATKDGSILRSWSKGADLENNNFVKRLNKSDVGTKPYDEDQFGDGQKDCRGHYLATPAQSILAMDDAGADPKDPQNNESARPNGVHMSARRDGHHSAIEINVKDQLNRILACTSNGTALELNQKHDYACLTTKTPETIARKFEKPYGNVPWSLKTLKGLNAEKYGFHLMLDFLNSYARFKTPKGQGVEMRDGNSKDPCGGTWTEIKDSEDRGMWFSKENNFGIWRDKKRKKYICINDSTDYIIIRNGIKTVQIYAEKDVEIIAKGSINMKAGGNVNISAGGQVNIKGAEVKAGPVLRTMDFYTNKMCGTHKSIQMPLHPAGHAPPCGSSPSSVSPVSMECTILKPEDFDKERGCDPTKKNKGPVDKAVVQCGPGQGGGGGGGGGSSTMDPKTGINPDVFDPSEGPPDIVTEISAGPPPEPAPVVDPIDSFSSNGVLWFGTASIFENTINSSGLARLAMSNPIYDPLNPPKYIPLAKTIDKATELAGLSTQKYGGDKLIYRIVAVDNGEALEQDNDKDIVQYRDDSINKLYVELYDKIT